MCYTELWAKLNVVLICIPSLQMLTESRRGVLPLDLCLNTLRGSP